MARAINELEGRLCESLVNAVSPRLLELETRVTELETRVSALETFRHSPTEPAPPPEP
jgi:hypothetical protein